MDAPTPSPVLSGKAAKVGKSSNSKISKSKSLGAGNATDSSTVEELV